MLKFRLAEVSDLKEIVRIYNSTIPSRMVTADLNFVTIEDRTDWFYKHNSNRPLWMIESEGNTVGWAGLQNFHEREAYDITAEISIYLDEKARGKGIGREILKEMVNRATSLNIENLVGLIFSHNLPSLHLFKSEGFEEWGNLPNVAKLDGIRRGLILMGKNIAVATIAQE
jgi:L-amino acid N-acyltransferase YncA